MIASTSTLGAVSCGFDTFLFPKTSTLGNVHPSIIGSVFGFAKSTPIFEIRVMLTITNNLIFFISLLRS